MTTPDVEVVEHTPPGEDDDTSYGSAEVEGHSVSNQTNKVLQRKDQD